MFRNLFLIVLSAISFAAHAEDFHNGYSPDVLGAGYECRYVVHPSGKRCTVVRNRLDESGSRKAMVYVHGYNDYFFQRELGEYANNNGFHFYAVDLHGYGRSLQASEDAFDCRNMEEYFPDLDSVIAIARREGCQEIVLMGHSTGGLIASLFCQANRGTGKVQALVLNSPFLDWNFGGMMEKVLLPSVSGLGALFPRMVANGAGKNVGGYAQSLLKQYHGEWTYNTEWKKPVAHHKRAGWVRAIHHGHKTVQKGCDIDCPILLMSSKRSEEETDEWNDEMSRADVVLDVEEIQKYGAKLGKQVTPVQIDNGLHDLLLSSPSVRSAAYTTIFDWIKQQGL